VGLKLSGIGKFVEGIIIRTSLELELLPRTLLIAKSPVVGTHTTSVIRVLIVVRRFSVRSVFVEFYSPVGTIDQPRRN
jgi:hypothetical protein